jgi:hypothetical protein
MGSWMAFQNFDELCQKLHFNLVFLSNKKKNIACTCRAYVETILLHTEHTRK